MDKRALRARIAELERVETRTAEQDGELKQLRRRLAQPQQGDDGQQRIVCDHRSSKFGDKFCRNCGEQISMPPRAAVAELLREILEEDYAISTDDAGAPDAGSSRIDSQSDADLLDAQWEAYSKKKEPFKIVNRNDTPPRFDDFAKFKQATPAQRKKAMEWRGVSERDIEEAKKRVGSGDSSRFAVKR